MTSSERITFRVPKGMSAKEALRRLTLFEQKLKLISAQASEAAEQRARHIWLAESANAKRYDKRPGRSNASVGNKIGFSPTSNGLGFRLNIETLNSQAWYWYIHEVGTPAPPRTYLIPNRNGSGMHTFTKPGVQSQIGRVMGGSKWRSFFWATPGDNLMVRANRGDRGKDVWQTLNKVKRPLGGLDTSADDKGRASVPRQELFIRRRFPTQIRSEIDGRHFVRLGVAEGTRVMRTRMQAEASRLFPGRA